VPEDTPPTVDDDFVRERTFEVALRDGGRATIRPAVPGDVGYLEPGFAQLSDESRHLRFLSAKPRLTAADIRHLADVDYERHFAWLALVEDDAEECAVAVGRWFRMADRPDAAEAAMTVIDAHQGRGLGSVLLTAIAASANDAGIRYIVGDFIAANSAIEHMLESVGAVTERPDQGILHVEVDLTEQTGIERSLRELLRAAAQGDLRRMTSI
jgi:GNAT superfamily N-acetyltransferase